MINLEHFRAGKFEKHHTGYIYFHPNTINEGWQWEEQSVNLLLETAAIKLGELNAFCTFSA
jgi:hypothetical protein